MEWAIIARKIDNVDNLNEKLIYMFPGESKTFSSFDSNEYDTINYYQEVYLNTSTTKGLPPHRYCRKIHHELQSGKLGNKNQYGYIFTYLDNECYN